MIGKILKPADNEKPGIIYEKLIDYCKVDITLPVFVEIYKNHCNLHLKKAFEDIVKYGRFVDFNKLLDVMLLFPDQIFDSFQTGQIESKRWLIQSINKLCLKHEPDILIVGGWHGVLYLMLSHYAYFKYTALTTDIDPDCTTIAQMFGCNAKTEDMFEIDYNDISQDLIINTSCEHIDFNKWINLIPAGKIVVLQSSDMEWDTHIDNIYSIDEFIKRANLSEVYKTGMKTLTKEWHRWMLIGKK